MKQLKHKLLKTIKRRIYVPIRNMVATNVKELDDPFVRYLRYANAGMMTRGNTYMFDHAVRNLPADSDKYPFVEVGSFAGLSTNIFTWLFRKHKREHRFVNVDGWVLGKPEDAVGESSVKFEEYNRFIKESYIRNVEHFSAGRLPYTFEMFSDEFFKHWEQEDKLTGVLGSEIKLGGPIASAYLDGDHHYDQVRRDFENVDKHLIPGGFIIFDDSYDGSGWEDINRLMGEIKALGRYAVEMQNPNYMFRKLR